MRVERHQLGGFVCTCERCGARAHVKGNPQDFARMHRCNQIGMGDVIAQGTKALGIKPCTPCEARRQKLNGLFPNFWRK